MLIVLAGTAGYSVIERWSLFDSLYMTVITLATVGYGETHPLSTPGRVFTLFLIMGGMGIILYGVSEVTQFIVQGGIGGIARETEDGAVHSEDPESLHPLRRRQQRTLYSRGTSPDEAFGRGGRAGSKEGPRAHGAGDPDGRRGRLG
ncbi:MAG: potassium channel family protein [Ignavibacteriales bacterium]|nr:potassium channel family protein [Ignavibacteriales bacterium]